MTKTVKFPEPKGEVKNPTVPEFGMVSKDRLQKMAKYIISLHPEEFEMFFIIQEAMGTKVELNNPE